MVTEGHYDLHALIDYDDGVTIEEFIVFHKATIRLQVERMQMMVHSFTLAIGSIFDSKVLKDFNQTIARAVAGLGPEPEKSKKANGHEAMRHTMGELGKLRAILG